jgi:hypothetical protein
MATRPKSIRIAASDSGSSTRDPAKPARTSKARGRDERERAASRPKQPPAVHQKVWKRGRGG